MRLGSKFTALSDYLFQSFFRVLFRYDIFISYARRDGKDYAVKLRDQLRQLDFSCFLDFDELPAGNSLNNTLRRALRRSATLVVVGTERAVKSRYVELEVGEFTRTNRAIIPIDIEGSLAGAPWPVVKERDLVWIDEVRAALDKGVPSPNVADQIDKLFKYTRRNSRVRAQVLATLGLFVVVVAASLFLIRQQVNAATAASSEAERQKDAAVAQKQVADRASADAEEQKRAAAAATTAAERAEEKALSASDKAEAAELAAGEAAAEAKRQESAALKSAARAREEQARAEKEQARAEERTRYVQAQQAGVQSGLAFDAGGALEHSVLLSVESLKRSLTPEGYIAWARAMELLPRPLADDYARGDEEVTALAYSPDGRWLAEGGNGSVTLRPSAGGGEPVRLPLKSKAPVKTIAFARGGDLLAATSLDEFELWDVRAVKLLKSLTGLNGGGAALSPDGRFVALTGPGHEPRVRVLDAATWSPVFETEIKDVRYAMGAAYSPDSRRLAVGFMPGKVLVWDVAKLGTGAAPQVVSLPADEELIHAIAYSPGGKYFAALSTPGSGMTLRTWRLSSDDAAGGATDGAAVEFGKTREMRAEQFNRPDLRALTIAFSPDDAYVAVASKGNVARVWETEGGREVARVEFAEGVEAAAFSPDGRALATTSDGVEFWKTEFGPEPVRLPHPNGVLAVAYSHGRGWLVTAGGGGVRVFRASDWSPVAALAEAGPVSELLFSPDGRWLAAAGEKKLVVYDTQTWQASKVFDGLEWETELSFSPDGCWLVVATGRRVMLLEYGSWREARDFAHSFKVEGVAFSPDGRRLSVRDDSGPRRGFRQIARTYVWGVDDGRLLACGAEHNKGGNPNASEPEKAPGTETLACPDHEGNPHAALLAEAQGWAKTQSASADLSESADGRWQAEEESNDVHLIFKDGNVVRRVARARLGYPLAGWVFTPDGRWLVVAGGKLVALWPLRPADMIAEACARLRRRDLTGGEWLFSEPKTEATCAR